MTQTDTTVGFLCLDEKKINKIKNRDINQKVLKTLSSFSTLKKNIRIPNKYKKFIRNAKKASFIFSDLNSYRVVSPNYMHHNFLKKFDYLYSSSANQNKQNYDETFALKNSNVIVYNFEKFTENNSSSIYKVTNHKIKKIR